MIDTTLPSLLALALAALALLVAGALAWRSRRGDRQKALPSEWALTARPVFNTEERRLHRQLREALPHHVVLAKLPLVRFCQPTDPHEVRYWYDLLGSTHVTFAICSPNGRVLAAIDFDHERSGSRRTLQIKQAVLGACRIRYLRCSPDHLPSVPELQLLVPQASLASRSPQAAATVSGFGAPPLREEREPLRPTVAPRRPRRPLLWQDSGFFHDSFFGVDSRMDASYPSEYSPFSSKTLAPQPGLRRANGRADDRFAPPATRTSRPMPLDNGIWPEEQRDVDDDRDDDHDTRREFGRDTPRYGSAGGR